MNPLTLTPQQHAFFDAFGYLAFPGLLSDRIGRIIESFEAVFDSFGGGHYGKPHDGKARSCIPRFIDNSGDLSTLIDDPKIHGILVSLLGEDFNYMGSDGNYYVGNTGWHSDGWHPTRLHVKIAFYLDPVARDSGCLRVIPGSHVPGQPYADRLQREIWKSQENWGVGGPDVPCVPLETTPGDIVLFNHNLKHASFHGASNRRMFTINACQRYAPDRLEELRNYIAGGARFWVEEPYAKPMLATASPQRKRHLEQVLANSDHLPALVAKAKETMAEPARG